MKPFSTLTTDAGWMLLRNIICITAGLLLWIYPDAFAVGVVIGTGILLLAYGIIAFLLLYRKQKHNTLTHTATINSVISLAVGLAFIVAPSFFAQWFLTVIGIIIAALALFQLMEIIALKRFAGSVSPLFFLSPLLLFGIGIVVIIKPQGIINLVGYMCAAALIYSGISGIFVAIRLKKTKTLSEETADGTIE
jgi:uncharacterized membrane protein HdeD (DUF308 family)